MLDADQIKVRLIDSLIEQGENNVIASEVSFYLGHRKADLIYMNSSSITAYEIKSDRDTLSKLADQLNDYSNTFPFCYLVTTEKHWKKARQLTPPKTGIILIKGKTVKVLRKATENKRLSKHSLTLGLSNQIVHRLTKGACEDSAPQEKRRLIEQKTSLQLLKEYFHEELLSKYQRKYDNFILDRGIKTTLTDLYYLQNNY